MEMLTAEQAKKLTPEQLAKRQAQKQTEFEAQRAAMKAQSLAFARMLPKDDDGVPYVKVRADDPDAWRALAFLSQRHRDRGDLEGRVRLISIAHAFELGYWKEI